MAPSLYAPLVVASALLAGGCADPVPPFDGQLDVGAIFVSAQFAWSLDRGAYVTATVDGREQRNGLEIGLYDVTWDPDTPETADRFCTLRLPLDGAAPPVPSDDTLVWYVVTWTPGAGAPTTDCDGQLDPALWTDDLIGALITPEAEGALFAGIGPDLSGGLLTLGGQLGVPAALGLIGTSAGVVDVQEGFGVEIDETGEVVRDGGGDPRFLPPDTIDNGGAGLPTGVYTLSALFPTAR